jgi:hypothetical protein
MRFQRATSSSHSSPAAGVHTAALHRGRGRKQQAARRAIGGHPEEIAGAVAHAAALVQCHDGVDLVRRHPQQAVVEQQAVGAVHAIGKYLDGAVGHALAQHPAIAGVVEVEDGFVRVERQSVRAERQRAGGRQQRIAREHLDLAGTAGGGFGDPVDRALEGVRHVEIACLVEDQPVDRGESLRSVGDHVLAAIGIGDVSWRWRRRCERSERHHVLDRRIGGEARIESLQLRRAEVQDVQLAVAEGDAGQWRGAEAALCQQASVGREPQQLVVAQRRRFARVEGADVDLAAGRIGSQAFRMAHVVGQHRERRHRQARDVCCVRGCACEQACQAQQ